MAVLLDIDLPDGSGLDALREIKGRRREAVVIMITANVVLQNTISALRGGAYDFVGKPIDFEAQGLLARVIQHEMDHLDGVLFIDHLSPVARDRIKKKIQKHGFPKERSSRAFAL